MAERVSRKSSLTSYAFQADATGRTRNTPRLFISKKLYLYGSEWLENLGGGGRRLLLLSGFLLAHRYPRISSKLGYGTTSSLCADSLGCLASIGRVCG